MAEISTKTLLHLTFCKRCCDQATREMGLCADCIIDYPSMAAEAAREFVEKEKKGRSDG